MNGTDFREGTNLLDVGSTDSEHEHFSLPPLKLKGHKPRSSSRKKPSAPSTCCCNSSTCVFTLLITIIFLCIAGLALFNYRLFGRLHKLEEHGVDTGSQSSVSEVQEVHSSVQSLKKQVEILTDICKKQNKTISDLNEQLTKVKTQTTSLGSSIGKLPELQNLPAQINQLRSEIAGHGSDITDLKQFKQEVESEGYTASINSIKSRLDELENNQSRESGGKGTGREQGGDIQNGPAIQKLQNDVLELQNSLRSLNISVQNLNSSIQNRFSLMSIHMEQHESHLQLLTNKTEDLQNQLAHMPLGGSLNTTTIIQGAVKAVVNILKTNRTLGIAPPINADIIAKVDNISDDVNELKAEFTQLSAALGTSGSPIGNAVTMEDLKEHISDFTAFKLAQQASAEAFNNSLRTLNSTVAQDVLPQLKAHAEHLNSLQQQLANMNDATKHMGSIKNTNINVGNPGGENATKSTTPIIPTEEQNTPSTNSRPKRSILLFNKGRQGSEQDVLHSKLLGNAADVKRYFERADILDDDKVNYNTLKGFLGPNLPPESDLAKFDKNLDNWFSLDELLTAFGFIATSTTQEPYVSTTEAAERFGSTGSFEGESKKNDKMENGKSNTDVGESEESQEGGTNWSWSSEKQWDRGQARNLGRSGSSRNHQP